MQYNPKKVRIKKLNLASKIPLKSFYENLYFNLISKLISNYISAKSYCSY